MIVILNFLNFFFQSPNTFFYAMILKFVHDLSNGAIYGKSSTFGSYQNRYQGNVSVYFLIKTVLYLN